MFEESGHAEVIEKNKDILLNSMNNVDYLPEGSEEREREAKIFKILSEEYRASLALAQQFKESDRRFALDRQKVEDDLTTQISIAEKELKNAYIQAAINVVSKCMFMFNYNQRFKDGLLFEKEGIVSSGTVKSMFQRMTDFMKTDR